jgi:FixJ family two-component response regulator
MQQTRDDKARILIADDEEAFLKMAATFLRNNGFECDCVRSADEAEIKLAKTAYDLLITDIQMPGNTDLEFLHKESFRSSFLPVIVVTGYPTLDTAVQSLRLAVVDYQTKPLKMNDFLDSVKSAIEKARTVRIMREMRQGFNAWLDQTSRMEATLLTPGAGKVLDADRSGGLDWYLSETINKFSNLSISLVNALQTLKTGLPEGKTDVCSLMRCSRLEAYENAIRDTVETLVRTKNSFKSKELAELRKKLEVLLKSIAHRD